MSNHFLSACTDSSSRLLSWRNFIGRKTIFAPSRRFDTFSVVYISASRSFWSLFHFIFVSKKNFIIYTAITLSLNHPPWIENVILEDMYDTGHWPVSYMSSKMTENKSSLTSGQRALVFVHKLLSEDYLKHLWRRNFKFSQMLNTRISYIQPWFGTVFRSLHAFELNRYPE